MKIIRFEQAGFIFEADSGFRLAVDVGSYTPIEKLEGIKADAMIVSHLHRDHLSPEQIRKLAPENLYISSECTEALGEEVISSKIITVKTDSKIMIENMEVEIFTVDHGPNVVQPRENFGFIFTIDGQKIYFAGDMFYGSELDVTTLEVDFALLPIGTFYTFGPEEAVVFAKTFKKIGKLVSMHDRQTPGLKEKFLELAKGSGFDAE